MIADTFNTFIELCFYFRPYKDSNIAINNKQFAKNNSNIAIVLMNAGIIPVYSSKDADILNYRKGLIAFYESEDYGPYADYFLNRQMERIREIEL